MQIKTAIKKRVALKKKTYKKIRSYVALALEIIIIIVPLSVAGRVWVGPFEIISVTLRVMTFIITVNTIKSQ